MYNITSQLMKKLLNYHRTRSVLRFYFDYSNITLDSILGSQLL